MPPAGAGEHWILFTDPLCLAPGTVIGVAFLSLWWRDRSARHHLWWGAASLFGAASTAFLDPAMQVDLAIPPGVRFTGACLLLATACYAIGARAARGFEPGAAVRRALFGAIAALIVLFNLITGPARVILFDATVAAGFLAGSVALWPLGLAERAAALMLAARAVNLSLLTGIVPGYEMLDRVRINQTLAFSIGLLLIVGAFLRSVRELRAMHESLEERAAEATRDLSDAEAELAVANRELEAFTYSVSHDLRAPLRTLDGYSRMLEEDCGGALDDADRAALDALRRDARDVATLVDGLLQVSRELRAAQGDDGGALAHSLLRRIAGAGPAGGSGA